MARASHVLLLFWWLARRRHAIVAVGIARQLHALTLGTLDQRQVEAVLPDWADGPQSGWL
eukprot:13935676-Alexandrium_andersonii.AAC.1